jgi:asparagine synthase (glutamine-hydrolysing)
MCGFVGIAAKVPVTNRSWLSVGRDAMLHRGPDDAGEWWSADGCVGLGHRRLSILELSPLGHQPMRVAERGVSIAFNGEIYNHKDLRRELIKQGFAFRSHSDTEVLLVAYLAWGEACLAKLNGMFAFALHDERTQSVLLVRDRAGEKPLFYRFANGSLQFASELKALLENPDAPRSIDLESLDCYLGMGFVPGERCILQGYNKLPPAHALSFSLSSGALRVWRYWALPEPPEVEHKKQVNESDLLDELEHLLEEAVGLQLTADVPVGVLLSGGIDSSLMTAMAARHSSDLHTFCIGFQGHGDFDETSHARLVARHFGTKHTELIAEPTSAELIPDLVRQFDEPMVDSSMIPTWLVAKLVKRHCKVAIGGDGGDELFGGYPYYSRLLWLCQKQAYIPAVVRSGFSHTANRWLPVGIKGRTYLQGLATDLRHDLPMEVTGVFDAMMRGKLMRNVSSYRLLAEETQRASIPLTPDVLQRATRMDFHNYLAEDLLVKVDRTSMLNSLEVRAPMLDYRLIEFAFGSVPSRLKATKSQRKILLKRLAARVLPAEFDMHRKQGFSIPLAEWLKHGPFRDLFWDTLSSPACMFDRSAVQDLLRWQDRGFDNGERLFALVQIELWRRHYGAELP